ncbi:T9SS type A sorting domain-containing protein [Hymenobacter negativus]|uniref:T9SS type A sorting domain-containing protein n=1 Tax=Hymenobacter negativus TaxID=2795026 RepID=A0ABS3QHR9_9BACT|nr:T9SS type A sorting domain-containing protein [Hymenobacter negativus]MBO2010782.1 T9SS type A sorting domain-containing protein [Hymenobacter negativus]
MSRLLLICQHLIIIGCWQLAVAVDAIAQPALMAEHKNLPRFENTFGKSFELPGRRFVHCGNALIRTLLTGKDELTLVVSTALGDTVRYRRLDRNPSQGGDRFVDAVLEPDYSITYLSMRFVPGPQPGIDIRTYELTQLDTLGQVRRQWSYPLYPVGTAVDATALLRVPDGYLVLANPVNAAASTPSATYTYAGAVKLDRQGAVVWQRTWPSRGYGGVGYLAGLVARPDGSYLAAGSADNGTPYTGGATSPRLDYWVVQFSPQGDTLRTVRFGVSPQLETATKVLNTRGGGAVIGGVRRLLPGGNNDAQLVQLDSLLRPQWTYTQPNTSNDYDSFGFVQPTTRGAVLFGGGRVDAAARQVRVELNCYTAAGVPRWFWAYRFGGPGSQRLTGLATWVSSADSSAYFMGGTRLTSTSTNPVYEDYFAHIANAGAPFLADLCREPPQAVLGYAPTAGGDSLRFVSLSSAGPRYAQLALWHWDFGDGTSYDGPAPPPHRYPAGTSAGTAVRLSVTNNLGCTSSQAVFPFALATAQARALAAQVQLYPNPTAGAVTLALAGLRAQGAVALEVVNVLGQVVLARTALVSQGAVREVLDLRALPAGVYTLRLRALEGVIVKRLVRE